MTRLVPALSLLGGCAELFGDDTGDAGVATEPYEGGWSIGPCHDDVVGEGNAEGQVAENFILADQYGESIELYSFCDRVVYVVFGATQDGPTRADADDLQELYAAHEGDGFMALEVLVQNDVGGDPTTADLQAWAANYQLTIPVLADPGGVVMSRFDTDSDELPMTVVLDEGVVIDTIRHASQLDAVARKF
ncbi:MAG: TlpA family protein disulfide reductase [Myxococcales bacterium]|nr:TlpA family protein disulfide reductase [Myxococcales bacterium]